jgi:ribosome-associated translation inhibitor RaiA
MQIQINTDHNLHGGESLAATVRATVEDALDRFNTQVTRVEVHLGDENAGKSGGDDKRCMMEARLEGQAPIAVTHHAATVAQAIDGAAERLVHRIEHTLGRLQDRRRHASPPPIEPEHD